MKTKILLSILMLVISVMGYASEEATNIPIEKMGYILAHPAVPVIVDSTTVQTLSDNYLWITTSIHYKVLVYEEGKPLNEFWQAGSSTTTFNLGMVIFIIIYSLSIMLGICFEQIFLFLIGLVSFFVALVVYADMMANPLQVLLAFFLFSFVIGILARKVKDEILGKQKLKLKLRYYC